MNEKNILHRFFKYVSLSILSMVALSLYILADTFFVANGVGKSGLAALNLALPIFTFIVSLGAMLGMGASTKFTILKSEGDKEEGNKIFTQAIIIGILAGVILFFIGLLFSDKIAVLLGADHQTKQNTSIYLKTILLFAPFFICNNILVCFVRNDNNPNLSMTAMIISSVSNIVFDYILVFPCDLGMFGAAIATAFSPVISMMILSIHFIKKKNNFKLKLKCIDLKNIWNFIRLGISSFITEFSSGVVILVFNYVILGIKGNIGVAAYGIIANIAIVCVSFFSGIGQGLQPVSSAAYGQKKFSDIKKVAFAGISLAIILGTLAFTFIFLFKDSIVTAFNDNNDAELQNIAVNGIVIYFTSFFIMGINIVAAAFFSSVEKPKYAFILSILRSCLFLIPTVLILPVFMDINGVWLTVPITELLTLIVTICFLTKYYKRLGKSKL